MTENIQIIHEIAKFLKGHNDKLKYVVNVETIPFHNYATCVIHEPGKVPYLHKERFTPFLYLKDIKKHGINLFNGDRDALISAIKEYGIIIKDLETGDQPRLKDGYTIRVSSTNSYNAIINFLKAGGLDMWEGNNKSQYFYTVSLEEQFFISTGVRLFKGLEKFSDVHKLIFDIETTSLRPFNGRVFLIGVRDNRGFETILRVNKEDDDKEERILIEKFFSIIDWVKPAIISGYNSEEFDFYFILERAKILGLLSEEKMKRYSKFIGNFPTTLTSEKDNNGRFRQNLQRRPNSTVKLGNTTDHYTATQMWGYSVTDIHHSVKRAAAVNTEIKNTKLKYIASINELAKPDRMYIKGDKIGEFYKENKVFIVNPINNNYERVPLQFQDDAEKLFQLQELRLKLDAEQYKEKRQSVLEGVNKELLDWLRTKSETFTNKYVLMRGEKIVERYLLDDLWETDKVDNLYSQSSFMLAKIVPTTYVRAATMGNASVWNLLMTTWSYEKNLAIPLPDVNEKFSGGLARCYRKGFNKDIIKLDFASLYPMLQLTYGIFPKFDITGVIRKMLLYLSTTRNIYKNLAKGKGLSETQIEVLKLIDEATYYKFINRIEFTPDEKNLFEVKQLPIKILNNSLFGALGSSEAFHWSDNICAARITCTGRIHLREMIMWFTKYKMIPLLAVTDGVNFSYPKFSKMNLDGIECDIEMKIDEIWKYEEYTGVKALVEKFNEEVMPKPFMSVDVDGMWESSLNLSRINYANLSAAGFDKKKNKEVPEKIKLTGNTIKSKVMPEYIAEFIDIGLDKILHGDGEGFVEAYNKYLEKIFFKQIPLKKIATKKRYKITVNQYLNRGLNKNGKKKAKMAHMEAVMLERNKIAYAEFEKLFGKAPEGVKRDDKEIYEAVGHLLPNEPEMDSYIYYVNAGTKKGHSDSAMIEKDGKLVLAANIINVKNLEDNPEMLGEYNVIKYVEAFNKRVDKILEGFEPNIRKMILVNNPANREFFSKSELELKSFPADNLEKSLILEDKELEFWNRTGLNPSDIWDGYRLGSPDDLEEIQEYEEKVKYLNEKFKERNDPRKVKSVNQQLEDGEFLLLKNFNIYDLYHFKDNNLMIAKPNVFSLNIEGDYDFIIMGLSKKTIKMKTEMAAKYKELNGISQEIKLSTVPNGLIELETFISAELEKQKAKEEEEEEIFDEDNDD